LPRTCRAVQAPYFTSFFQTYSTVMICTVLIKDSTSPAFPSHASRPHESHICHPPIARLPVRNEPIRALYPVLSIGSHEWLRPPYSLSRNQKMLLLLLLLVQIRKRKTPTRPTMRDRLLRTSSFYYEPSHWSSQQEPRSAKRFRGFADLPRESIAVCWRNGRRCTILWCVVCVVSTLE
jgi:hypothetical protein